ncbi:MAG: phosphoribosylformylglycinamidine synthase [Bacteroidetes bacterium]|nr:phosphoribosylformylglycinamidine synthase [Bacteroidota bacterium]
MITFFKNSDHFYAVESAQTLANNDLEKLKWLFGGTECSGKPVLQGSFVGSRREMVTPWSTNAVEIAQNMGIAGIGRIEEFVKIEKSEIRNPKSEIRNPKSEILFDPMLQHLYQGLDQEIFHILHEPDPVRFIEDIDAYNKQEGLALSNDEIIYLVELRRRLGRMLTDSEVFGFSQVNSEHCRHKIFNGIFIIDGKEMPYSLFELIRKTAKENPNFLVSAYKDNVAFIMGPEMEQFAPNRQDVADFFTIRNISSVISIKAETHNFPTTVEPFNGAATGSGGEIRDRMAGGKGSIPMAGTAVYMTSYPRLEAGRSWETDIEARPWLYKTPEDILIKASNGASDFGNKFGQALICGSVFTFEHEENGQTFGYDKVIMMAGGIGYARKSDSLKEQPEEGQSIVVMGGDNYRIGMGGGAVSSVATGEFENAIELNAVQRSNPEMQKRVFNAIRAMTEMDVNPIVSIHDHGAGGHLNSLSELVEDTGGIININALPVGDPTLSAREIISNESQERMGLVIRDEDLALLEAVAHRERAPLCVAGRTTGDHQLIFRDHNDDSNPIDLRMEDFFGKPPTTIIRDKSRPVIYSQLTYNRERLSEYLENVLQLEGVACKDWLTNKVDRAVSGKIAKQQSCGTIQLPLNNLGVVAIDYTGTKGIATSIGHAPAAAMIDPIAGSRLAIAEALTNLVWAPLSHGLKGVSLSANWMWPCKNSGEDARLYAAVKAVSDFAIELGVNIPTGKDSLSMTQKYPGGKAVYAPGTVIISAVGEVSDIRRVISPVLLDVPDSHLLYIGFSRDLMKLGGSSFAQVVNALGNEVPTIKDSAWFIRVFEAVQQIIEKNMVIAGHDISAGGLIVSLLEMCFPAEGLGIDADLTPLEERDAIKALFSENPGIIVQVVDLDAIREIFKLARVEFTRIGSIRHDRILSVRNGSDNHSFDIDRLRDTWFRTSYLLDRKQSGEALALLRYRNFREQPLRFRFNESFTGTFGQYSIDPQRRTSSGIRAAIIREKGVNRDRDMAWALYLAGFDVKDIHTTDLISGREDLTDVNMIAFVGGFSNSDVLGSAKGWAGAFLYNERAKLALDNFFKRDNTLSLGVCNGCQLIVELGLIYPGQKDHPKMSWNDSHKYECSFVGLDILENHSVMLKSLAGSKLGIWVAHGEGKFNFPGTEDQYHIPAKFSYQDYPGNPNGSQFDAACIASADGRHLAIMPHLEDSVLPWQWAWYPENRSSDEITPWIEAFVNAREWVRLHD